MAAVAIAAPPAEFFYPLEQEEAFLEAEQDDLRHTQASIGLKSATAVSGGTNGGL